MSLIRMLEEHNFQAVPATRTEPYDGWLVRLSDGRTKRTNSVNFLESGTIPAEEKISYCEDLFAQAGLPSCFRVTPLVHPIDLDCLLADHGYRKDDRTDVLIQDLSSFQAPDDLSDVIMEDTLSSAWLDAHARIKNLSDQEVKGLQKTLTNIALPCCFARIVRDNRTVSLGLGVLSKEVMGLFDFMTDTAYKRQGLAAKVTNRLLQDAQSRGLKHAYLQVVHENESGRQFWHALGFTEHLYSYHYRLK